MGLKKSVRQYMERRLDNSYEKRLRSYVLDYADWIRDMEWVRRWEINEAERAARAKLPAGDGPEVVLLSFGQGTWTEDAGERMRRFFLLNPQVALAYGDEDVMDAGGVCGSPWLKPCWSPDSYLYRDYLGYAVAVRRDLYDKLSEEERGDEGKCHDALVALAKGFERGCKTIAHVDGIFFHRKAMWPMPGEGRPGQMDEDTAGAVRLEREKETMVSVIIPSKDNTAVLKRCLETLCGTVRSVPYEIIVVDNGSRREAKDEIREELAALSGNPAYGECLRRAEYVYEPKVFNFSYMCNKGASIARGKLLLFLNDDIEAVEEGWLERMVSKAVQPWAGAVGHKLLYPDGERIQHAGVTNILEGATHKLQFLKNGGRYYDGRSEGVWNMLGVTGACLLIRREVFQEAGGFCEKLQVAFNDVDLCFNLYELGYQNIVINTHYLLHHESLSRGTDGTEEKFNRLMGEYNLLFKRHPQLKSRDPYYHIWLNENAYDPAIKPACEEGILVEDVRDYTCGGLGRAREDDCLMVRADILTPRRLRGYIVVLGSDNACYTKKILFRNKKYPEIVYQIEYTEQYRSDLEKNMDQVNVALSGFQVELARPLPPGEYLVGAYARDRISGAELVNWGDYLVKVSGEDFQWPNVYKKEMLTRRRNKKG